MWNNRVTFSSGDVELKDNAGITKSQKTKGEGDCAFHAALGKWNPITSQFETENVAAKRKRMAEAVKNCQADTALFDLVKMAIMMLVMDNVSMEGEAYKSLKKAYRDYESSDNSLNASKWATFENEILQPQYNTIVKHIDDFIENYIQERSFDEFNLRRLRSNFRDKFFTCQNEDDGILRALIMSFPALESAYLDYKRPANSEDYDPLLSNPALLMEYAEFISTPGRWFLPCELIIISHVFDISIEYYASSVALPDYFNCGKTNTVSVCFNGYNHYERMSNQQLHNSPISTDTKNKEEKKTELFSLKQSMNTIQIHAISEQLNEINQSSTIPNPILMQHLQQGDELLINDEKDATQSYIKMLNLAYQIPTRNDEYQLLGYQRLGDVYHQRNDSINAISLYNFALAISQDKEKSALFNQPIEIYQKELIEKIKIAEKQFLSSVMKNSEIISSDYQLDIAHQKYLKGIRDYARSRLSRHNALTEMIERQPPNDVSRLDKINNIEKVLQQEDLTIQQIYQQINAQLRGFVRVLIEECKQVLGKPPCDYAIICFGSLARDEATPYSDFEFGILLGENQDTEENKDYFRNLTKLLNIKVINLGETTPRMQDIKELEEIGLLGRYAESPIKHGFCFDGNNKEGRKTPLGNKQFDDINENLKYELILTPRLMAQLQNNEWYKKDKHLSTVLMTSALIDGNEKLLTDYNQEISMVLAISAIQERAIAWLKESTGKFEPRMGIEEEHHFFSAKYDLYRLPNMVLDHLATYFQINELSIWRKVDGLFEIGIFNKQATVNLKNTISDIVKLRLKTYLKYDQQNNRIIALDKFDSEKNKKLLEKFFGVEQTDLFELYYSLIPLYWTVFDFSNRRDTEYLKNKEYYDPSYFVKSEINIRLFNFKQAIIEAQQAKSQFEAENDQKKLMAVLSDLGVAYYCLHENYESDLLAIDYYKQALVLIEDQDPNKATILNNIGDAYRGLDGQSNTLEAIKYCTQALDIYESQLKIYDARTIMILTSLGQAYVDLEGAENIHRGIHYFEKALSICEEHIGIDNPIVSHVFIDLGQAYSCLETRENILLAISFIKKALILNEKYLGKKHLSTADTLTMLGNIYCKIYDQKSIFEAIQYHQQSLEIYKQHFDNENTEIATKLNNLGNAYCELGGINNIKRAIEYYNKAQAIFQFNLGAEHPKVALTLNNLGTAYHDLGDRVSNEQAIKCHQQALDIYIKCFSSEHPKVAGCFLNLGNIYCELGEDRNIHEAIEYYKKTLIINQTVLGLEDAHTAQVLNALNSAYNELGGRENTIVAMNYGEQALAIYKKCFGQKHRMIAETLNNLGNTYLALSTQQDINTAITLHNQAFEMYKEQLGLEHPETIMSLNNLGNAYVKLSGKENIYQGIYYHRQALTIVEKCWGSNHIQATSTLNGLGSAYGHLGGYENIIEAIKFYEKALEIEQLWLGSEHPRIAATLYSLGNGYIELGGADNVRKAIVYCEQALAIQKKLLGFDNPQIAETLNNLGNAYCNLSGRENIQLAIEFYLQALSIREKKLGCENAKTAMSWNNLGTAYYLLGEQHNLEKAIIFYKKALKVQEKILGLTHIETAMTLNNLGAAYTDLKGIKNLLEAKKYLLQAQNIFLKNAIVNHPFMQNNVNNLDELCRMYTIYYRYNEAVEMLKIVLKIKIEIFNQNHFLVADTLLNLGNIYQEQCNYEAAIDILTQAKEIYRKIFNLNHITVANTLNSLGNTYVELRQFDHARVAFNQAIQIYQNFNSPREQLAINNLKMSYVREGNLSMLQEQIDIDVVRRCYQLSGLTLDPSQFETHEILAHNFSNFLVVASEHYKIAIKLNPTNVLAYSMLARLTHVRAEIEKNKVDINNFHFYLNKADIYFKKTIQLSPSVGTYTAYAQFMLKNLSDYTINKIIEYLVLATQSRNIDFILSYSHTERLIVDENIEYLFDKYEEIKLIANHLARYLLVKAYQIDNQPLKAEQELKTFSDEVENLQQSYEQMQRELLEEEELSIQTQTEKSALIHQKEFHQQHTVSLEYQLTYDLLKISKQIITCCESGALQILDTKEAYEELESASKVLQTNDLKKFSRSNEGQSIFKGFLITATGDAHNKMKKRLEVILGNECKNFQGFFCAIDEREYGSALRIVCMRNEEKVLILVNILLEYKEVLLINVNEQREVNGSIFSAIYYAAENGNQALYDLLVQHGADENSPYDNEINVREYMKKNQLRKNLN